MMRCCLADYCHPVQSSAWARRVRFSTRATDPPPFCIFPSCRSGGGSHRNCASFEAPAAAAGAPLTPALPLAPPCRQQHGMDKGP